MPTRIRRPLHALLALALLAWFAAGTVREVDRTTTRQRHGNPRRPFLWRPGMAPVRALEGTLRRVDALLPPGQPLAFHSRDDQPSDALFRWRWAAYLLAEREVVPYRPAVLGKLTDYLLACGVEPGVEPGEPSLAELARDGSCNLYRVRPPAAASPGPEPPG